MADYSYDSLCREVEDIQTEESEVDKYIKTLSKLKESSFNPCKDGSIDDMISKLSATRAELSEKYSRVYSCMIEEASCMAAAVEAAYGESRPAHGDVACVE